MCKWLKLQFASLRRNISMKTEKERKPPASTLGKKAYLMTWLICLKSTKTQINTIAALIAQLACKHEKFCRKSTLTTKCYLIISPNKTNEAISIRYLDEQKNTLLYEIWHKVALYVCRAFFTYSIRCMPSVLVEISKWCIMHIHILSCIRS